MQEMKAIIMEAKTSQPDSSLMTISEDQQSDNSTTVQRSHRILIIDDNRSIHEDFRSIFKRPGSENIDVSQEEAVIFGTTPGLAVYEDFEIDSAFQGQEGLEKIRQALNEGRPYAMAFVDVRMPPGWDGVETIQRIWKEYPELQVTVCTAYSDYSWMNFIERFGQTDKLLILKKPFDNIEVRQIACSLAEKWYLSRQVQFEQKKLETLVDNLSNQLRMTGLLQRDFLPDKLPDTDRIRWDTIFLPAEWASGDIYDVVRLDEHHIGFYVADVVGHGVPAAILAIFLKHILVMCEIIDNAAHIFSPSEVMNALNTKMLAQQLSGNPFVTCCYCLLNTETLELTYARSGHPYPVLMRRGEQPKNLEIKGSLLGVFEQPEYPQQTVQLQSGDKLLLYSDGAEPIIMGVDEGGNSNFREDFCENRDLTVAETIKKLNILAQDQENMPSEIDDITVIGFEIL